MKNKIPIIIFIIIILAIIWIFIKPKGLGYYYCWDDGRNHQGYGNPHRIGYEVEGDHICTKRELFNLDY